MGEFQKLKGRGYIPLQPELEMNTDYYVEHKERNVLNQLTILFYQFKTSKDVVNSIIVIPDGCIDILFSCNQQNLAATVYGSVLQSKPLILQAECEYFGVRFLPQQYSKNLNYSMKEMIGREVPLVDFVTIDFTAVERIIAENNFYGRIHLFKEVIGNAIFTKCPSTSIVRYALNRIYFSKGAVNINELAAETAYSTRYLRKLFEEYVGLSPKLFCQITRFQYSLHMFNKRNNYTIWDVINENGYYDQAHLINEFKKFGYMTPKQFMKKVSKRPKIE